MSHRNIKTMISAAAANNMKFTQKNPALCSYLSHMLDNTPLNLFPIEVAKNQPPIINDVKRGGLSLDVSDNPIGLKHNSPIVITIYDMMNHQLEALIAPLLLAYTAPTIISVDKAEITNPNAIFAGVLGSLPLRRKNAKNATTKGVNIITQPGFTD